MIIIYYQNISQRICKINRKKKENKEEESWANWLTLLNKKSQLEILQKYLKIDSFNLNNINKEKQDCMHYIQ